MRAKASFILLACLVATALTNPLKNFPLTTEDIFEPLIHSDSDTDAEKIYRQRMRNIYGLELQSTNKPHAILTELGTLKAVDLVNRFNEDREEYVAGILYQAFFAVMDRLNDQKAIAEIFEEVGRNYNARRLQQALVEVEELERQGKLDGRKKIVKQVPETVDPIINDDVIARVFDYFLKKENIQVSEDKEKKGYAGLADDDLKKVDREFVLEVACRAFQKKVEEGLRMSRIILDYRQAPLFEAGETLQAVMGYLLHNKIRKEDVPLIAARVMNFVHLADMVKNPEATAWFTGQLGEIFTQKAFVQLAPSPDFVQTLVAKVLKTAAHSSSVEGKKQAKKILVAYFTDLQDYEEPTPAYINLIRRKYTKFGLKSWAADGPLEYKRMIRIYYLDLLRTSLVAEPDFLDVFALNKLFLDFEKLIPEYDERQHKVFLSLRRMLLATGDVMDKLPLLFESLYDSFLHAAQYYTYRHSNTESSVPVFYNAYLDEMWDWKKGWVTSWFQWEPKPQDFPINILENYSFFKLINLTTNFGELGSIDIKFRDFEYQNNYPIHKYSTEAGARQFFNFIRLRLFPQQSFNYRHLKKLEIPQRVMREYAQYASVDRTD